MISIYVATHKNYAFPKDKGYIPLHVGKEKSTTVLPYIGDNTNDSISIFNESFCELTGLYWLWKNVDSPIVGLVHYRRYFSYKKKIRNIYFHAIASSSDFNEFKNGCDIILPKKSPLGEGLTVKEQYSFIHHEKDIEIIRDIIIQRHNDYLSAFDKVMLGKEMFSCNMFISKNIVMKEYSSWLFDILFEAKEKIDILEYDKYQKRVFGFISERLFNVWIEKNKKNLKVAYRDIVEIKEEVKLSKIRKYYKEKIKNMIRNLNPTI
ncbi:DUF4422 domain-containing protein [Pectobacterium carotovorum]|uniref:DUF4422 domain-containing protein n=1 Tax=Pectobacterium carotovorum TaxID=554 RepID=UPI0015E005A0|nr:DUF4422 domain-containing protein [Pectobacterium carotovorum]MBA0178566.1 DUF4422 domain-containing protein [Pectobacterium carotovorum]